MASASPLQEGPGAGARDGAEIVDQLLAVHADAGVGDRERAGRLVGLDADREPSVAGQQLRLGDRLVAQLVAGVGGVGDQLAQEDLGLGIDRMNHQVQEFGDLRLEDVGLGRCACGVHLHPLQGGISRRWI